MPLRRSITKRDIAVTLRTNTQREIEVTRQDRVGTVVSKHPDGMATVVDDLGSCPQRSASGRGARIGDVVSGLGFRQTGSTGASSSTSTSGDTIWLDRQEPMSLPRGETTAVTYFGLGFKPGFFVQYLRPFEFWANPEIPEINEDFVRGEITIIDDKTVSASVTVTADAEWVSELDGFVFRDVRYGIGTEPTE